MTLEGTPSEWVMAMALAVPRIGGMFLVMPLFSRQVIPPTVRNTIFVALALAVFPTVLLQAPAALFESPAWILVIAKETFIGMAIGFLFGAVFWALQVAGGVVDTHSGGNFSGTIDPLQGTQTTLTAQWLTQLAVALFFASGAILILLDVVFRSYALWPVLDYWPRLERAGMALFIGEFDYIMTTGIMMAAPVMLALSLVDFAFGLVNRYAQQMNVLQFILGVKNWLRTWMMILVLGTLLELVFRRWDENRGLLDRLMQAL